MAHSLLQEIYLKHAPEIYRFSFFKVKNKEEAEDITAETFTRLANTNIGAIENVRAWLFKVCRNIIYDTYMRGAERNIQKVDSDMAIDVQDNDASVEDIVIESSLRQAIQESLQKIDQPVADIIVMKVWEGMQFNEIALATESNISTVKAQYYRGIDKIKEITVQGNPKYRTYSFTAPIVAAGVFTMGQSSQFTISSAAVSAVGASAGIILTGAATTASVATVGLFSAGAIQAVAAIVATSAVAIGGIAGVQYLSNQNESPTTIECIKTFERKADLEFSFSYDSCKYVLSEQKNTTQQKDSDITLTPKDKVHEYKVSLAINKDISITGNTNIFCGDEFLLFKDTSIARVRAYKFESNEEFIYYGTILKSKDLTYPRTKTMQDIDGKNSKNSFRARLVGSSKQILCVNNSGIARLGLDNSNEQGDGTFSSLHLSIEGNGLSKMSTDLKLIDDLAKSIKLIKKQNKGIVDTSTWKGTNIELGQSVESRIVFIGSLKAPVDSVVNKDITVSDALPIDVRIRNSEFNLDITYILRSAEQTYVYDSLSEIESEFFGKLYRLTKDDLTHTYTSVISKNMDCDLFSPKVKAPCGFGYIIFPKLDDSFNGISVECKGEATVCDQSVKSLSVESNISEKLIEKSFTLEFDPTRSNIQKQVTIMVPEDSIITTELLESSWPVAELEAADFKMKFILPYESFPVSFIGKQTTKLSDNLWLVEFSDAIMNSRLIIDNIQTTDCGSVMFGVIKPPCSKSPLIKGVMIECVGDEKKCATVIKTLKVSESSNIIKPKDYQIEIVGVVESLPIRINFKAPYIDDINIQNTAINIAVFDIGGRAKISLSAHEQFAESLSGYQEFFEHSLYGKTFIHLLLQSESTASPVYSFSNSVEEINSCKSPFYKEGIPPLCGFRSFERLNTLCEGDLQTCINVVKSMIIHRAIN